MAFVNKGAAISNPPGHARVAAGEYSRECLVAELESEAVAHAVGKGFPRQDIPHFLCFYKQCLTLLAPPSGGDQGTRRIQMFIVVIHVNGL